MKKSLAAVGSLLMALALTGCDNFRDAAVENGCGESIEIARSPGGDSGEVLAVGETTEFHSSGGKFDVVVRSVGDDEWPVKLKWSRIENSALQDGVPFVIEGEDCPATRG